MPLVSAKQFNYSEEFDLSKGDLKSLEIRDSERADGYHYFYDSQVGRLIKTFILSDRAQTAVMCDVTLIRKPAAGISPRLRLWIKDKTKGGREVEESELVYTDLTKRVRSVVDLKGVHREFWILIGFLQSCTQLDLPRETFKAIPSADATLIELLRQDDRQSVIKAIQAAIGSSLSERDITLIANRREQLNHFKRLLHEEGFFLKELDRTGKKPEKYWQDFFEQNRWIFGYGLRLVVCEGLDEKKLERLTTGASLFVGAGKRPDAVMKTKANGLIGSLVFCEIKKHDTHLLADQPYRNPDVYCASWDLKGAVAQVQKTSRKALRSLNQQINRMYNPDGSPTGVEVSTTRPRQIVLIGSLTEFQGQHGANAEKVETFELFRTSLTDTEVITYDELYERARYIVEDDTSDNEPDSHRTLDMPYQRHLPEEHRQ